MDGRHRGHKPTKEMKQAIKNIGLGKSKMRSYARQYTSLENKTIEKLHENDWLKKKSIWER